jgi:hypothetical protein
MHVNDTQAIERYRYLLRTAPPDAIERAHEEAFAQLTPEQRRQVLRELSTQVDASEVTGNDPKSLARTATRAEMRQPGTIERTFGGAGVPGLGSMFLSTLAGAFVGSAIADAMFDSSDGGESGSDAGTTDESVEVAAADDGGGDAGDIGGDSRDFGGGDFGGDFGGGDLGGGDFGV